MTVTLKMLLTVPDVAVIVAVPGPTAVTTPVALTLAAAVLLLENVTAGLTRTLPLASTTRAVSVTVCPMSNSHRAYRSQRNRRRSANHAGRGEGGRECAGGGDQRVRAGRRSELPAPDFRDAGCVGIRRAGRNRPATATNGKRHEDVRNRVAKCVSELHRGRNGDGVADGGRLASPVTLAVAVADPIDATAGNVTAARAPAVAVTV